MNQRLKRLGSEMSKVIYESIGKIKDPECTEMVSVLECNVNSELKDAEVIVSIYSTDEEKRQKTFKAIQKAAPFIKHELSVKMTSRTVPTLHFKLDNSAEYSAHINSILATLDIKNDESGEQK